MTYKIKITIFFNLLFFHQYFTKAIENEEFNHRIANVLCSGSVCLAVCSSSISHSAGRDVCVRRLDRPSDGCVCVGACVCCYVSCVYSVCGWCVSSSQRVCFCIVIQQTLTLNEEIPTELMNPKEAAISRTGPLLDGESLVSPVGSRHYN